MRFRAQTADTARPQSSWLRVITLLCVFLLGSVSVAQAAHIHGRWLPHSAPELTKQTTGPAATTEDACPLCVAMHSALPVHRVLAPAVILLEAVPMPAGTVRSAAWLWHFELFSRPPPVLLS